MYLKINVSKSKIIVFDRENDVSNSSYLLLAKDQKKWISLNPNNGKIGKEILKAK